MPALGSRQFMNMSYRDSTGEVGSLRLYANEITAVSLPGFLTAFGNLQLTIDAITLGERAKQSWGEETIVSNATPANQVAQRESKLLVQYRGATTEAPFTVTIPTIDPSKLVFLPGGGDAVAFTVGNGASAEILAFVTAFEAGVKSPDDETEAVEITGMRFVGRNS